MRNGFRPNKGSFFSGGEYTSTGGKFPFNPFVPVGSKIPARITDMDGYLRAFPGTYLKPTVTGYIQLFSMYFAYRYFANFGLPIIGEDKCNCR